MFYQEKPFIGYSHVQVLNPRLGNFNRSLAHIVIASCQKATKGKYSYGTKFNRDNMRKTVIYLPKKNNEIDFDFIDSLVAELKAERVAELQAERVAELQAYLSITGLIDYELTQAEQDCLNLFKNASSSISWVKYNLKSLFGSSTRGKRLKSADRIDGSLPFVTAGEENTGISAFIGNSVDVFKKNTITIDMFGSAKYRNYDYGADDHIAVVHTEALDKFATLFLTSAIEKVSHQGQFNYGRNFYAKDADALNVFLPTVQGQPDYKFMALLISAVQKLVIKDVVDYARREAQAYQLVS